jgi:hypothetical protein
MFDERECVMCRCDVQALLPPALSAEDAAAMLTTHLPGTLKLLGAAGKRKDGEGEGGVVLLETVETLTLTLTPTLTLTRTLTLTLTLTLTQVVVGGEAMSVLRAQLGALTRTAAESKTQSVVTEAVEVEEAEHKEERGGVAAEKHAAGDDSDDDFRGAAPAVGCKDRVATPVELQGLF